MLKYIKPWKKLFYIHIDAMVADNTTKNLKAQHPSWKMAITYAFVRRIKNTKK